MKHEKIPREYLKKLDKECKNIFSIEFIPLIFDYALKYLIYKNQYVFRKFFIDTLYIENIANNDYLYFLNEDFDLIHRNPHKTDDDLFVAIGHKMLIYINTSTTRFNGKKMAPYIPTDSQTGLRMVMDIDDYIDNLYKENNVYNEIDDDGHPERVITSREFSLPGNDDKVYDEIVGPIFYIKDLDKYRNLWYTKKRGLRKDEVFLAALASRSYTELYDILKSILSENDLYGFMWSVINMRDDDFIVEQWYQYKHYRSEMNDNIRYGKSVREYEIIEKMLENNIDINLISKISGDSVDDIKRRFLDE